MKISSEPLIRAETLQTRVEEMAAVIEEDYRGGALTLVVVLNGALFFAADLLRRLRADIRLECVHARSYAGAASTGEVLIQARELEFVAGRDVLIIEDIVDTGRTARALLERLREQQPASLALCALLDKTAYREENYSPDYVGFTVNDQFVVGYGLDFNGRYRHLPQLYVLA